MNENIDNTTIPCFQSGYKIAGSALVGRVDPDGTVTWQDKWTHNLLLNNGMNHLGANRFLRMMTYTVAGTGSRVNKFDSGGSMVSQSGTLLGLSGSGTITDWSSSADFYANMLQFGDVILLADGTEIMVVSASNATTAFAFSSSATIAPQTFTIWKTSQGALHSTRIISTGYVAGQCGSNVTKNTLTLFTTSDFPVQASMSVFTEVGVANQSQIVCSRVLLNTPIAIPAGSQIRVKYAMAVSIYPSASVYYPSDMIANWPGSSGTASMQNLRMESFDSNGNVADLRDYPTEAYNPQLGGFISYNTGSVGEPLLSGTAPISRNTSAPAYYRGSSITNVAYITNTFFLARTASFNVSTGTGSLYRSFGWGNREQYGEPGRTDQIGWAYLMDNSQSKTDIQTLEFSWRTDWDRTYVS